MQKKTVKTSKNPKIGHGDLLMISQNEVNKLRVNKQSQAALRRSYR